METAPSARFAAVYGTIPRNGTKPQVRHGPEGYAGSG
jgi:hypothetical protein